MHCVRTTFDIHVNCPVGQDGSADQENRPTGQEEGGKGVEVPTQPQVGGGGSEEDGQVSSVEARRRLVVGPD